MNQSKNEELITLDSAELSLDTEPSIQLSAEDAVMLLRSCPGAADVTSYLKNVSQREQQYSTPEGVVQEGMVAVPASSL